MTEPLRNLSASDIGIPMSEADKSAGPAVVVQLQMVGAPDAAVCEDDSCLLPGAGLPAADGKLEDGEAAHVEPGPVG